MDSLAVFAPAVCLLFSFSLEGRRCCFHQSKASSSWRKDSYIFHSSSLGELLDLNFAKHSLRSLAFFPKPSASQTKYDPKLDSLNSQLP